MKVGFVVVGCFLNVMFLKMLSDSFPISEERTGTVKMDLAVLGEALRCLLS